MSKFVNNMLFLAAGIVSTAFAIMVLFFTEEMYGTPILTVTFIVAASLLAASGVAWIRGDAVEEQPERQRIFIYRDAKGLHLVPEKDERSIYADVEIIFPERVCARTDGKTIKITGNAFTLTNGVRTSIPKKLQVSIPRVFNDEKKVLEEISSFYPLV